MEDSVSFTNVWLLDDDADDCELFEDALKYISSRTKLTAISNGDELLLSMNNNKPDILFLDINVPGKNGLEVLKEIRTGSEFTEIPVVIFSSSVHQRDIDSAYAYGANLYYSKPTSFRELIAGLQILLKLDWNDPNKIRSSNLINGKYVPFRLANSDS